MPWSVDDVDAHVKGLTPSQKSAWVKIANDTLDRTKDEGKAIRIANAAAQRVGKSITAEEALTLESFQVGRVAKVDAAQGLVYGWASVVDEQGVPVTDLQGDQIEPPVLEGAMVDFMLHHRASGEMHEGDDVGTVIESVVFTPEKLEAMGFGSEIAKSMPTGAWIGVKLDPASPTFAKVQSGELAMFSIQGTATREAA